MTTDPMTVHLLVEGRVQGVGYRAWCAGEAGRRNLSGWVRNLKSGSVETVLTGPADTVADMIDALWRGPTWAQVRAVTELAPVDPATGPFDVRSTV